MTPNAQEWEKAHRRYGCWLSQNKDGVLCRQQTDYDSAAWVWLYLMGVIPKRDLAAIYHNGYKPQAQSLDLHH